MFDVFEQNVFFFVCISHKILLPEQFVHKKKIIFRCNFNIFCFFYAQLLTNCSHFSSNFLQRVLHLTCRPISIKFFSHFGLIYTKLFSCLIQFYFVKKSSSKVSYSIQFPPNSSHFLSNVHEFLLLFCQMSTKFSFFVQSPPK